MTLLNRHEAYEVVRTHRFYVYSMCDASGRPFYIGKGTGERIRRHELAINPGDRSMRANVLAKMRRKGAPIFYRIEGLFDLEEEAFEMECALIAKYGRRDKGTGTLVNGTAGGEGASNPSEETRRKLSESSRRVMSDPEHRARVVAALKSREATRKISVRAALQSEKYRKETSARFTKLWTDPEFVARRADGLSAMWNKPEVRERHLVAMRRLQRDPVHMERIKAARHSPQANAKRKASLARPETVAKKSAQALEQRRKQERAKALALETTQGLDYAMPNWRASVAEWNRVDLFATIGAIHGRE